MAIQNEYRMRTNRTIDYIQSHYAEDLSLEKLASIACFSSPMRERIIAGSN